MNPFSPRTRVLGLVGQNENGVLHHASLGFGACLDRLGFETEVIDLLADDGFPRLGSAIDKGGLAFVFGFAGVGSRLKTNDGNNLWTSSQVPFASLWYDHPSYNYQQHAVDSPYVLNAYHIQDHLDIKRRYLSSSSPAILLPFRQEIHWLLDTVPWSERDSKILFPKTAEIPQEFLRRWETHPPKLKAILHDIVNVATQDRNCDLMLLTEKAFAAHNVPTHDQDSFMGVVQECDRYVRAWRSDKLANALLPFPAVIMGRGWDYLDAKTCRATITGPISGEAYTNHVMRYRVLANSNPLLRNGLHERIGFALASGCLSLTDRTQLSDKFFDGLGSYIGFEWEEDQIQTAIEESLHKANNSDGFWQESGDRVRQTMGMPIESYIQHLLDALHGLEKCQALTL